jgi:hypothetical protein
MKYLKLFIPVFCIGITFSACKKEKFVEVNTNPETLYDIPPANQFLNATISAHNTDFEWFYDYYRRIMPWMQMNTANTGNGKTFIEDAGNFNQRYGNFFGNVGNRLFDVGKLIAKMPAEEQTKMQHMQAITNVLMAYYAFYVSDINGSMPFEQAFQARYGGTLTPAYDSQEMLFNELDALVKASINTLKTVPAASQTSLDKYDLYFKGESTSWIKAANALRLKMAMRLMKRNPEKMKTIATEVLASPAADLMTSNADGWVLATIAGFSGGGNFNPDGFRAPKASVDFMKTYGDPRVRFYYQKNKWGEYVGSVASPDAALSDNYKRLYSTVDTLSNLQYRLFQSAFNGGTGLTYFPVITYPDFCFMRAELGARGVTTESAESWYKLGVEYSLRLYDKWASDAKIQERNAAGVYVDSYAALSDAEVNTYLDKASIKFEAGKALEQIAVQAYINFYKQPNEAWALYKRTGFPNPTSMLALERLLSDGIEQDVPRRAPLRVASSTDANFANNSAALADMAKDTDFGSGPSDVFGRVWWDKK